MKRRLWIATVLGLLIAACGASVSAVYEGDVRFERCMALDWQRDVDPQIRQGCWEEWQHYYTLGQTRDRIEYAKLQLDKLAPSAVPASSVAAPLAVPDPTSAFVPPPMMLAGPDAGSTTDGGPPDAQVDAAPAKSACETACDDFDVECMNICKGAPVCSKGCAVRRSRCLERCKY